MTKKDQLKALLSLRDTIGRTSAACKPAIMKEALDACIQELESQEEKIKTPIKDSTCDKCGKTKLLYNVQLPKNHRLWLCQDCLYETGKYLQKRSFDVENAQFKKDASSRAIDPEFARIVKKFYKPFESLSKYWEEEHIINIIATHADASKIIQEQPFPAGEGRKPYQQPHEFYKTDYAYLPRYTKSGEQLLFGERKKCDIYHIPNQHQNLIDGEVMLDLIYTSWPELRQFNFSAYSMHYNSLDKYEIYPGNKLNLYTPLQAILKHNPGIIEKRSLDYAKSYNHGDFTFDKIVEHIGSPEGQHYLNTIRNLKPVEETIGGKKI